mmetsp:Transcript_3956/g.11852  ORF Transcript_3956/g.11852 Transcript_3956/m.11852 type:complete len:117 (+) Transcript_3956:283-633(+)
MDELVSLSHDTSSGSGSSLASPIPRTPLLEREERMQQVQIWAEAASQLHCRLNTHKESLFSISGRLPRRGSEADKEDTPSRENLGPSSSGKVFETLTTELQRSGRKPMRTRGRLPS